MMIAGQSPDLEGLLLSALLVPEFVKRLPIHLMSLQYCDMLHVHAVILWVRV